MWSETRRARTRTRSARARPGRAASRSSAPAAPPSCTRRTGDATSQNCARIAPNCARIARACTAPPSARRSARGGGGARPAAPGHESISTGSGRTGFVLPGADPLAVAHPHAKGGGGRRSRHTQQHAAGSSSLAGPSLGSSGRWYPGTARTHMHSCRRTADSQTRGTAPPRARHAPCRYALR